MFSRHRKYCAPDDMDYKASLDTLAKVMTAGVFVLFFGIGLMSVYAIRDAAGDRTTLLIHGGVLVMFVAIFLGSWLYAPQSYTLDTTALSINRPIGKVVINRSSIKEARLIGEGELKSTIRTFGNGGLFGYYGKYYNATIGHMTWYLTQPKNRILIVTTEGKKIVISPDDAGLVDNLKR
ncbi:MAG: hypothetical protein IPL92_11135 [Saprospiraceae bacterium]|nr:hypothetical protein [Candidatus Opimibacter iunctus]